MNVKEMKQDFDNGVLLSKVSFGKLIEYALELEAAFSIGNDAKDAARYRWLRNSGCVAAGNLTNSLSFPMYTMNDVHRDKLDAHIDAAILAEKTQS